MGLRPVKPFRESVSFDVNADGQYPQVGHSFCRHTEGVTEGPTNMFLTDCILGVWSEGVSIIIYGPGIVVSQCTTHLEMQVTTMGYECLLLSLGAPELRLLVES